MQERYPPIEPYDEGMLDVGDGNLVYWEACGNPEGKPALLVHGGPGSGLGVGNRRYFDPKRYRVFPFEWARFRVGVPEAERDGDLVAAYARLMESPDPNVRNKAAADWLAWEDAVISLEPNGTPGSYSAQLPHEALAFVRICAHYFS